MAFEFEQTASNAALRRTVSREEELVTRKTSYARLMAHHRKKAREQAKAERLEAERMKEARWEFSDEDEEDYVIGGKHHVGRMRRKRHDRSGRRRKSAVLHRKPRQNLVSFLDEKFKAQYEHISSLPRERLTGSGFVDPQKKSHGSSREELTFIGFRHVERRRKKRTRAFSAGDAGAKAGRRGRAGSVHRRALRRTIWTTLGSHARAPSRIRSLLGNGRAVARGMSSPKLLEQQTAQQPMPAVDENLALPVVVHSPRDAVRDTAAAEGADDGAGPVLPEPELDAEAKAKARRALMEKKTVYEAECNKAGVLVRPGMIVHDETGTIFVAQNGMSGKSVVAAARAVADDAGPGMLVTINVAGNSIAPHEMNMLLQHDDWADTVYPEPMRKHAYTFQAHVDEAAARDVIAGTHLTQLSIEGNMVMQEECVAGRVSAILIGRSWRTVGLRDLNLASTGLSDRTTEILAKGLRKCPTLVRLNLRDNRISDRGAQALLDALSFAEQEEDASLRDLNLAWNHIRDTCAEFLEKLYDLEVLDLSWNPIGTTKERAPSKYSAAAPRFQAPSIGQRLAFVLAQNTALHWLDLSHTCIGRDDVARLATGLFHNHTLFELRLSHLRSGLHFATDALGFIRLVRDNKRVHIKGDARIESIRKHFSGLDDFVPERSQKHEKKMRGASVPQLPEDMRLPGTWLELPHVLERTVASPNFQHCWISGGWSEQRIVWSNFGARDLAGGTEELQRQIDIHKENQLKKHVRREQAPQPARSTPSGASSALAEANRKAAKASGTGAMVHGVKEEKSINVHLLIDHWHAFPMRMRKNPYTGAREPTLDRILPPGRLFFFFSINGGLRLQHRDGPEPLGGWLPLMKDRHDLETKKCLNKTGVFHYIDIAPRPPGTPLLLHKVQGIRPGRVMGRLAFDLRRTMFASRATLSDGRAFVDNPRHVRACFNSDWAVANCSEALVKLLEVGKAPASVLQPVLKECRELLQEHYYDLVQTFLHQSCMCVNAFRSHDVLTLSGKGWKDMLANAGLINDRSLIPANMAHIIFGRANADSARAQLDKRKMTRVEFINAVIRVAANVSLDVKDIPKALEFVVRDHMLGRLERHMPDTWRRKHLYTDKIASFFSRRRMQVKDLFCLASSFTGRPPLRVDQQAWGVPGDSLCIEDWSRLVRSLGVMQPFVDYLKKSTNKKTASADGKNKKKTGKKNTRASKRKAGRFNFGGADSEEDKEEEEIDTTVGTMEVTMVFVRSMMLQSNRHLSDNFRRIDFPSFLEALARLADILYAHRSPPDEEDDVTIMGAHGHNSAAGKQLEVKKRKERRNAPSRPSRTVSEKLRRRLSMRRGLSMYQIDGTEDASDVYANVEESLKRLWRGPVARLLDLVGRDDGSFRKYAKLATKTRKLPDLKKDGTWVTVNETSMVNGRRVHVHVVSTRRVVEI